LMCTLKIPRGKEKISGDLLMIDKNSIFICTAEFYTIIYFEQNNYRPSCSTNEGEQKCDLVQLQQYII